MYILQNDDSIKLNLSSAFSCWVSGVTSPTLFPIPFSLDKKQREARWPGVGREEWREGK